MAQNTLVIDLDRCIGCFACEIACKNENNIPLGVYYNKVLTMGPVGEFPKIKMHFLPSVCQNCREAPCVKVCPTGASYYTDTGHQVLVNKEKCIGCRMCMAACPYGARSYNAEAKVVEKCTLCRHLQEVGSKPACVKVCCARARFFGDIDDPESDVAKKVAEAGEENVHSMPDRGNHPSVRYIMHPKTGKWEANPPKMI